MKGSFALSQPTSQGRCAPNSLRCSKVQGPEGKGYQGLKLCGSWACQENNLLFPTVTGEGPFWGSDIYPGFQEAALPQKQLLTVVKTLNQLQAQLPSLSKNTNAVFHFSSAAKQSWKVVMLGEIDILVLFNTNTFFGWLYLAPYILGAISECHAQWKIALWGQEPNTEGTGLPGIPLDGAHPPSSTEIFPFCANHLSGKLQMSR